MAEPCIVCIGDPILDVDLRGAVSRHAPDDPDCPVLAVAGRTSRPGGATGVAAEVVRRGGRCSLLGVVGDDAAGLELQRLLEAAGVRCGLIRDHGRATTVKTRLYDGERCLLRADVESTAPVTPEAEATLLDWAEFALRDASACVLSDYAKGVVTDGLARGLVELCRKYGVPLIVDPKRTDWSVYRGCSLIKPNRAEWEAAGRPLPSADFPAILVTDGPRGAMLYRNCTPEGMSRPKPAGESAGPLDHYSKVVDMSRYPATSGDPGGPGAGDRLAARLALGIGAGAATLAPAFAAAPP